MRPIKVKIRDTAPAFHGCLANVLDCDHTGNCVLLVKWDGQGHAISKWTRLNCSLSDVDVISSGG